MNGYEWEVTGDAEVLCRIPSYQNENYLKLRVEWITGHWFPQVVQTHGQFHE